MPKLNLYSRDNTYSLDNLTELFYTYLNQEVKTTSSPTFENLTISDTLESDTLNVGTLNINDSLNLTSNILNLNVGNNVPIGISGIQIDRTAGPDYQIIFDESDDNTYIGAIGDLKRIIPFKNTTLTDSYLLKYNSLTNDLETTNTISSRLYLDSLSINTNSTNSRFVLSGNASIGSGYTGVSSPTNGLIVQGNVGIGTTNPSSFFQADISNSGLRTTKLNIGNTTNNNYILNIIDSDINSLGEQLIIQAGASNNTTTSNQYRFIYTYNSNNSDDNLFSIKMRDSLEYLNIKGNGNVGIGTDNPSGKLHIYEDTNVPIYIIGSSSGFNPTILYSEVQVSKGGQINIVSSDYTRDFAIGIYADTFDNGNSFILNNSNTDLIFGTNAVERMRIKNAGNVGIGTDNPTSKLHIEGSTYINGNTTIENGNTLSVGISGESSNFTVYGRVNIYGSGHDNLNQIPLHVDPQQLTNMSDAHNYHYTYFSQPSNSSGSTTGNAYTVYIQGQPLGTISNSYSLYVNTGKVYLGGTIQYNNSPTNGYVLTSDATGNATWQAPAGGAGYSQPSITVSVTTDLTSNLNTASTLTLQTEKVNLLSQGTTRNLNITIRISHTGDTIITGLTKTYIKFPLPDLGTNFTTLRQISGTLQGIVLDNYSSPTSVINLENCYLLPNCGISGITENTASTDIIASFTSSNTLTDDYILYISVTYNI